MLDPESGAHVFRVLEPKHLIKCKTILLTKCESKPGEGILIIPEVLPGKEAEVIRTIPKTTYFLEHMVTEIAARPPLLDSKGNSIMPPELSEVIKYDIYWEDGTIMAGKIKLIDTMQFDTKLKLLLYLKAGLITSNNTWEEAEVNKSRHIIKNCEL